MTYKQINYLFGWVPFWTNAFLALAAFYLTPQDFTQNAIYCYWTAAIACGAAMTSLIGFLVNDIGPRRTLFAILGQSPVLIVTFAGIYRGQGLISNCASEPVVLLNDAATPLYFSIVTWTTVGYGDFVATEAIRLVAALEAVIGYGFFGMAVGLGTYLLSTKGNKWSHTDRPAGT